MKCGPFVPFNPEVRLSHAHVEMAQLATDLTCGRLSHPHKDKTPFAEGTRNSLYLGHALSPW